MIAFFLSLFLSLSLFSPLHAKEKQTIKESKKTAQPKICLNMIVKDESRVIKRCLNSVKGIIDYWVIVDTGSTDGTQEIIKAHLKDIPGELYERPWRNFGANRTEALELAKGKGEYLLFMDADDILEYEVDFKPANLSQDLYYMWRGPKGHSYMKPQLVRASLPWRWVGVTHEYLDCGEHHTWQLLENVKYVSADGGARSYDPQKFLKNVKLLKEELKKEPNNERNAFYLAESYYDAGRKGKALEWYQKRISMGGWAEEMFWSMLRSAHILREIGLPSTVVLASYTHAHEFRPHRPEPVYFLAEMYNQLGNHSKAYEVLKAREFIPKPAQKDFLFNIDWIEEYGLLFQLSICAYYVGNHQEALDACDKLLTIKDLPRDWRKQVEVNRTFPLTKLEAPVIPKAA